MSICLLTTRHALFDDLIYFRHARSLAKRYRRVSLVGPDEGGSAASENGPSTVQLIRITTARGWLGRFKRICAALGALKRLAPDVCHIYDPELLALLPVLRRYCRIGVVYDALEAYPEAALARSGVPTQLKRGLAWAVDVFEKRMARMAVKVFTADEATAADFTRRGIPAVCLFNFPPKSLYDSTASPYPMHATSFRGRAAAIYVGSMSPDRGLFKMIEATALVRKAAGDFTLILIGLKDGPLLEKARQCIEQCSVTQGVHIVPWIPHEQVRSYIEAATLGLAPLQSIPKYYKNIPQKIFEYMACGVPVVGANLPTIAPFIQSSGCGVVADCTRPDALAAAILSLLADEDARKQMGASGKSAFLHQYNWENMEPRLWAAYDDLELSGQ